MATLGHQKQLPNGSRHSENEYIHYFLSEEAVEQLPLFQYKGQDLSLTYKYVLSPLAETCVQRFVPRSMAPNTITLIGLVFMICSYLATWWYLPLILFENETDQQQHADAMPRWAFLLNAIATLLYQTLDNMDGKQARRVGASSPLGLLFDHGCDAVNSVFGSANWMVCLALCRSDEVWVFSTLMGPYAMFFISTWEEYYSGELIMPIINGPNEGLLGAVVVSLLSFAYGPSYWQTESLWSTWLREPLSSLLPGSTMKAMGSFRNADILLFVSSIGFVQEVVSKSVFVVRSYGMSSILDQLPFLTLFMCYLLVGMTDASVWLDMPRTSIHLCSFLFVEMTTELMLKHVTKQLYEPYRVILLPLVLLTVIVCTNSQQLVDLKTYLLVYCSMTGTYVSMKCAIVIHEICSVLGIWCFDITKPRRKRPRGITSKVQ